MGAKRRPRAASRAAARMLLCAALAAGCACCSNSHPHPAAGRAGGARPAHAARAAVCGCAGCSTATAAAAGLPGVRTSMLRLSGGNPFGAVVTPDGRWAFVSLGGTVAVLRTRPSLALIRTITLPDGLRPGLGEALTSDGRYLLVAAGSGAVVINVARAEQGAAGAVAGTLGEAAPGSRQALATDSAIEVAVPPGNRLAIVTLEYAGEAAVYNLARALTSGFSPADLVGNIPLGDAAVGMAVSPDGRWLYATSELATPGSLPPGAADRGMGSLSVISLARAETDPAASVVARVPAGCQPVRVITSANGGEVWVTARASDALLGFSAAELRSDPSRALDADVRVGEAPVGLVLARDGSRIVVADSNRFGQAGASANLAVISVPAALAGKPALLGYVRAGLFPRQFALAPGGATLFATNYVSAQVETVDVGTLP